MANSLIHKIRVILFPQRTRSMGSGKDDTYSSSLCQTDILPLVLSRLVQCRYWLV